MDITIHPTKLCGEIQAIPSKSHAHRVLISAAFSDAPTQIQCILTNDDIEATAECLRALGAKIRRTDCGYYVEPVAEIHAHATLNCNESGSTLRFMLPIVGALGVDAEFIMSGRLPERPLSPLWEEMERMGCQLSRPAQNTLRCQGKLTPGTYTIDGGVSSQFITGLLFAIPFIDGKCDLQITGTLESKPYIDLTEKVLRDFGVNSNTLKNSHLPFRSPGTVVIEGDWSNAAFFLAAAQIGCDITVSGVSDASPQGDRAIKTLLPQIKQSFSTISAANIPDLVPILAICAACFQGAHFTHIGRLRIKESDRVATVCTMLQKFGAKTETTENTLTVYPAPFSGCTVDAAGDHRIAMAAAIAATVAKGDVTILGAQCVNKSYPTFWEDYLKLGGYYEQHIR